MQKGHSTAGTTILQATLELRVEDLSFYHCLSFSHHHYYHCHLSRHPFVSQIKYIVQHSFIDSNKSVDKVEVELLRRFGVQHHRQSLARRIRLEELLYPWLNDPYAWLVVGWINKKLTGLNWSWKETKLLTFGDKPFRSWSKRSFLFTSPGSLFLEFWKRKAALTAHFWSMPTSREVKNFLAPFCFKFILVSRWRPE